MSSTPFYYYVTRPYGEYADEKFSIEALKYQKAILGNPNFPSPEPDMPTFLIAVEDFTGKIALAGSKDVDAVAARNTSRIALTELCVQLGSSLTATANGGLDALTSPRMPIRKLSQQIVLDTPTNLSITVGKASGTLIGKVKAVKGANSYVYEYMPVGGTVWQMQSSTTARCIITGLVGGTKYYIRVTALGARNQATTGPQMLSPYAPE
jgi:hypothetical protein